MAGCEGVLTSSFLGDFLGVFLGDFFNDLLGVFGPAGGLLMINSEPEGPGCGSLKRSSAACVCGVLVDVADGSKSSDIVVIDVAPFRLLDNMVDDVSEGGTVTVDEDDWLLLEFSGSI